MYAAAEYAAKTEITPGIEKTRRNSEESEDFENSGGLNTTKRNKLNKGKRKVSKKLTNSNISACSQSKKDYNLVDLNKPLIQKKGAIRGQSGNRNNLTKRSSSRNVLRLPESPLREEEIKVYNEYDW